MGRWVPSKYDESGHRSSLGAAPILPNRPCCTALAEIVCGDRSLSVEQKVTRAPWPNW